MHSQASIRKLTVSPWAIIIDLLLTKHFHNWFDYNIYNRFAFLIELLEWGQENSGK